MKNIVALILICSPMLFAAQTQMLAEFKAMPAFPAGAREAYKASNVNVTGGGCFYVGSSAAMSAYQKKLQSDNKPYQDLIIAKGNAGMAPGMGAASDFSDLNSPETQAKLAKMSQEEKIKFAMEIQARMNANKNVQEANAIIKPGPLTNLVLKLSASSQDLLNAMTPFASSGSPVYELCSKLCNEYDSPLCADKIALCNNKTSRLFYDNEIVKYNAAIKNAQSQYNLKKSAFENNLKEFDAQAARYSKNEIAVECSNVFSMLMSIALKLEDYEKQGAMILVNAKNNPYCGKEF